MPKITLNGKQINAKSGQSILSVAYENGIKIPTLCFMKEINEIGYCRMCVVEVATEKDLVSACDTPIKKGMVIETDSERVIESRTASLTLLARRHKFNCWTCPRGEGSCDFYNLLKDYSVDDFQFGPAKGRFGHQIPGAAITQDQTKCVLCKRCVAVCSDVVTAKALKFRDEDANNPIVSPTPGLSFDESGCISCGECTKVCPTGALIETDHMDRVEEAIRLGKHVVAQLDPAVKGAIGESFGYKLGESVKAVEPKLHEALAEVGFSEVSEISDSADVVLMEQASELLSRLDGNGKLPMFTSSSAGWIRYVEQFLPEYLENISSVKSPQMVNAAIVRKENKDAFIVSVLPSTAGKYEIERSEFAGQVDAVLTTREFARMLKKNKVILRDLEDSEVTSFAGFGKMFGAVGVETVGTLSQAAALTGSTVNVEFAQVQTQDAVVELSVSFGGHSLNVAVVQGGRGIKQFFETLAQSKKEYHFVEVVDNFGGLLNGGGQPIVHTEYILGTNVAELRTNDFMTEAELPQNNPFVKAVYTDGLGKPGSNEAHKLLHTKYSKKSFRRE